MSLLDDSPIVETFCQLGIKPLTTDDMIDNPTYEQLDLIIPDELKPLEHFMRSVYSTKDPYNVADLRWELFRTKLREGETLPPSKGAYIPHLMRANFVSMCDKSYTEYCPQLPEIKVSGWNEDSDRYSPIQSFLLPAPKSVIGLLKCGCKAGCIPKYCRCAKESLTCTPLCKCYNSMCQNPHTKHDLRLGDADDADGDEDDESDEEE